MFCIFYFVKIQKLLICNKSTTTEAREKSNTDLESFNCFKMLMHAWTNLITIKFLPNKMISINSQGNWWVKPDKSQWGGWLSTFDLLVLISLDQIVFTLKILLSFFTKQATLMRRSTVLNLQLVFPGETLPIIKNKVCHEYIPHIVLTAWHFPLSLQQKWLKY